MPVKRKHSTETNTIPIRAPILDVGYVNLYGSDITEHKRVEEELRVLSTRQEAILVAVPDILMEVNKDKVYTWANPAGIKFFGEEVIGKEAAFYFKGEQDTYGQVKPLFNGSEDVFYVESWQRRKDGEKRLLAWWCRVLKDADGNVVGALSSAHDITERKRAEALQEAIYQIGEATDKTASLEDLYSTLHAIIGRVMQARNFYIALYDAGNSLISFPYFVDEVDRSAPAAPAKAGRGMTEYVIRTGKPLLSDTANFKELVRQGEVELVGSPSPIWLGAPLVVEGQTIGVIAAQDYSDSHAYGEQELRILEFVSGQVAKAIQSKRAETALRESEERFRSLFEDSPISLWEEDFSAVKRILVALRKRGVKDFRTYLKSHPKVVEECAALVRIVDVNKATLKLYQAGSKEELIKNMATGFSDDSYESFREELVQIAEGKIQFSWEGTNQTLDGKRLNVSLSWSVAPGHESDLSKIIISIIDITERKRTEAEHNALLEIMQGLAATENLQEFLQLIHQAIAKVISAENFSFVLHNKSSGLFEEIYAVDKYDATMPPSKLEKSITSYVFRTGEPLVLNQATFKELEARGEVELIGTNSKSWLGAPLRTLKETIGVIAVQNYEVSDCYSERDRDFLASVGVQVSLAIERRRAEEALRGSESSLQAVLQSTADGILAVGSGNEVLYANERFVEMWRIPQAVLASKDDSALLQHVLDQLSNPQSFLKKVQELYKSKEESFDTLEFKDGRIFERLSCPLMQETELRGRVWSFRDITARKHAEAALYEAEKNYRSLFENVPDGVYRSTLTGKFLSVNPALVEIFSYSSVDELLGADIPRDLFIHPEARQSWTNVLLQKDELRNIETVMRRKDGQQIIVLENTRVIRDAQGNPLYFEGSLTDITELKRAEEAIRQAEARYRSVVEQVPVILYTEALDHRTIFVSPKVEAVLGYTPEEWMSEPGFWKRAVHPDDFRRVVAEDDRTNQIGEPFQIEYRMIRKDGQVIWVRDEALLVTDNGKPIFWQCVMYDITARKASEATLQRQLKEITALHSIAAAGIQTAGEDELIELVTRSVGDTFYPDNFGILLFDEAEQILRPHPSYKGIFLRDAPKFIALAQGLCGLAVSSGKPVRVSEVRRETAYLPISPEIRSELCVPIKIGTRVIGAINSESRQPDFFSEADERLLVTIAGQLAAVIESLRAEAEIVRRVNELEVLYENGLAISRILEPHEIGEKIIEIFNRRLNWHHAAIRLYDPQMKRMEVVAFNYPGLTKEERIAHLEKLRKRITEPGKGLSGWVIQHGESILCEDVRQDPRYIRTYPGIRSGLYVPLKAGTNVIGSIAIESTRVEAFTAQDQRLLETVAAQAAIAIENARLYQDTVRAAERRAVLYHASQEIAAAGLDLEQIYRSIHQAASQLMPLDLFAITLADENQKVLHGVYLIDRGERYPAVDAGWGTGLAGYVIREKKSIRIADYHKQKPAKAVWFGGPGTPRSIISVPLHSGTKIVGVLSVQNYRADIYGEEDEILLKTLAAYAGTAIENSRLFEETRRRAAELSVLVGVSSGMRTASTPAEMYSVIVDMVMELFHADGASLSLHDTLTGENIVMAGGGKFADYVGYRIPPGAGGTGIVIRTGEPYLTLDSRTDEHVYNPNSSPDMGAMAFVPLATREGIIGVLSAGREGAISETDVSLLTAIADIAANAIENSRLFESEHEQHQLSDALRDALSAGASLSSTLDFDEVLDHLLGAVEGILPYDDASILLVDHSGREAAIARTRGRAPGGEKTSQFFKDFRFNVTTTENLRWMAEYKQPLVIPDVTSYPGWITVEGTEAIRSWAGAPIIVNGKVIAFFSLAKNVINFYGPQHARLLEAFTGQASLAFQNARLFAETQSRLRFLTALHTIDTAIGASVDLRITLSIILENVTRELKVDAAAVALMNPHSRLLEYTASRGFRSRIVEGLRVKPGDGLVGQAAIQRHAVSSSDAGQVDGKSGSSTDSFKDEGFASQYAIPLIAKGQVQGILQLCHRTELNPGQDWLDFLDTLAGQAAIAIDNARMFENLQTSNLDLLLAYDATIQGWAQALDMRDRETEDHTRRVADITLTLAGAMSMNDSELEHIRRGALLHDIGKIGIPDIILLKPGPLTDEEWAIMRTHPVKAYEMLSPIAYLHPALDIPYCHHEKWDGSGYPRGLNGAQIPLAARIFAVVDVFDALTSDRPYRSAWSREQALDYIKEQTGKHFDPRVVEVFLKMKNQAA